MVDIKRLAARRCIAIAFLAVGAGCASEGKQADDTQSPDHLLFTWDDGGSREVQLYANLGECRNEEEGCYTVVELKGAPENAGSGSKGHLSEEQIATLKDLVTPQQLERYQEETDPTCEGWRYAIFYIDSAGYSHSYCLLPGDHLSSETEHAIEVLTEMSEQLLEEGTPVEDKN